jgi:hypothetical protein
MMYSDHVSDRAQMTQGIARTDDGPALRDHKAIVLDDG